MNSEDQPETLDSHQSGTGLGREDVFLTLFRHKWLILAFTCLGVVGVIAALRLNPPRYESTAKLLVRYVLDTKSVNPASEGAQITSPNGSVINSEIEILRSVDVAAQVADIVGPAKILAMVNGGTNRMSAAGVIMSGMTVEVPPQTDVMAITFKHRDPQLVQPVLSALIDVYMRKHMEVHQGVGVLDEYYSKQRDELREKLAATEEEIKKLKTDAKVVSLDGSKHSYQDQIAKLTDELLSAETELAERKAVLGDATNVVSTISDTDALQASVPPEKVNDYTAAAVQLDNLKQRERELRLQFTEAHPQVRALRSQIADLAGQKSALEQQYPALTNLGLATVQNNTNSFGVDIGSEVTHIKALSARVHIIGVLLSNVQSEASSVMALEPAIAELQRQRDSEEANYRYYLSTIEQAQMGETLGPGKVTNMSIVERPTPPYLDTKKLIKPLFGLFAACVACGVGLAFLIDFGLNRKIRRSADIKRFLRLPVFLTIPDTSWTGCFHLHWPSFKRNRKSQPARQSTGTGEKPPVESALAVWDPSHHLQSFAEGLRERLITYFEINNLTHKPKLVAVTGCDAGAGVSTLASGLAAALSKTGEGNVLLVDMNSGQGVAHSFYRGQLGCGLSEALEPDNRAEAQVEENLYVASMEQEGNNRLPKVLPKLFNHLVPKLKTSDYDYIIFDMPPVSPTSATPRLASHMDIVLLVLESEKTAQQSASRASALLSESRANVAAVLNKWRRRVPGVLSHDL